MKTGDRQNLDIELNSSTSLLNFHPNFKDLTPDYSKMRKVGTKKKQYFALHPNYSSSLTKADVFPVIQLTNLDSYKNVATKWNDDSKNSQVQTQSDESMTE